MAITVEQVDLWRASRSENQRLEFKEAKNQFDSERLCEYCVALANAERTKTYRRRWISRGR